MNTAQQPVPDGTPVTYHGSITAAHGRWIAQLCVCDRCWLALVGGLIAGVPVQPPSRFQLADPDTGRVHIEHVRRASITPTDPAT